MTPNSRLLVLTFAGVFVEIGYCVWGFAQGAPLWLIPAQLGAYHAGYLLCRLAIFREPRVPNHLLLATGAGILAIATYASAWPGICAGLLLFSTALQVARRSLKTQAAIGSRTKNVAKTLAMAAGAAGALPASWLALIMAFGAGALPLLALTSSPSAPRPIAETRIPPRRDLLWFEFVHHAHYFAYCYTLWILLGPSWIPFIGPLFIVGWLGYFALERVLRERSHVYSSRLLALGHLSCAIAIALMLAIDSALVILFLWCLTGIGGGTAYMLGNVPNTGDRELYEDLGHVAGCFGAAVIVLLSGAPLASLALAVFLALVATLMASSPSERAKANVGLA